MISIIINAVILSNLYQASQSGQVASSKQPSGTMVNSKAAAAIDVSNKNFTSKYIKLKTKISY